MDGWYDQFTMQHISSSFYMNENISQCDLVLSSHAHIFIAKMSAQSSPLLTKSSSTNVPDPDDEEVKNSDFKSKAYATRWLVLAVFFLHVLYTNLAWSNVDSIADLAECYYNVDVFWINSLSYMFYVTYVLFFVLATWFLGRFGLRWAAIVSGCFGAAGAWIKFAGVGEFT